MREHYSHTGLSFKQSENERRGRWCKYAKGRLFTGSSDALGKGRRARFPTVNDILDYGQNTGRPGRAEWRTMKALENLPIGVDKRDRIHA